MHTLRRIGLTAITMTLLAAVAGCPSVDPRTSNQGGGSLLTAGAKLAGDDVGGLNPDEWQILVDQAPTLASQFGVDLGSFSSAPALSDEQAAALVSWLAENGITSLADLETFGQNIANGTVTVPAELLEWAESVNWV